MWAAAGTAALGMFVAAGHALAAGPVNVVHPPVPVIVPHPVPPPVAAPPPVHVVVPPAPPPPVHVHVPTPPPVHVAAPPPVPAAHVDVPPATSAAEHAPVPTPGAAAPAPSVAAAPSRTFDPLAPPTADPGLGNQPPTSTAVITPPGRAAVRARAVVPTTTATRLPPTVHLRQLPPPPPVRPTEPVESVTAAAKALPAPPTARPDSSVAAGLSRTLADPPASVPTVANVPANVAGVAMPGQPVTLPSPARLPVDPGLVEALTAPFTFAPAHPAVAPRPAPSVAVTDNAAAPAAQSEQEHAAATRDAASSAAAAAAAETNAASRQVTGKSASRPFGSTMQYLTSHLMPIVRSPFGLPRQMSGVIESWARSPWPLSRLAQQVEDSLGDSSAAIAAVVIGALIAMTGLTVAGAAIGGRQLKHTAWRRGRARYRPELPWDMAAADDQPQPQPRRLPAGKEAVMPWPGKAAAGPDGVREAELAVRRRRVA